MCRRRPSAYNGLVFIHCPTRGQIHRTSADQCSTSSARHVPYPPHPSIHTIYHCSWSCTLYKIAFPLFSSIVGHPELSTSVFSSSRSVVSLCGCPDSSTSPLRISPSEHYSAGSTLLPGQVLYERDQFLFPHRNATNIPIEQPFSVIIIRVPIASCG